MRLPTMSSVAEHVPATTPARRQAWLLDAIASCGGTDKCHGSLVIKLPGLTMMLKGRWHVPRQLDMLSPQASLHGPGFVVSCDVSRCSGGITRDAGVMLLVGEVAR